MLSASGTKRLKSFAFWESQARGQNRRAGSPRGHGNGKTGCEVLVLLRHKWRVLLRAIFRTQQGHLDKRLARATIIRRRRVAIELGMWRSGLIGGASGSVTGGKAKLREPRGGKRSRGGNRSPLGDQEAVCGDAVWHGDESLAILALHSAQARILA